MDVRRHFRSHDCINHSDALTKVCMDPSIYVLHVDEIMINFPVYRLQYKNVISYVSRLFLGVVVEINLHVDICVLNPLRVRVMGVCVVRHRGIENGAVGFGMLNCPLFTCSRCCIIYCVSSVYS